MTGSSLTLGTAGSRRTVYLIDENTKLPDTTQPPDAAGATPSPNNSHAHLDQPVPSTLLMYNRISNVIGTIGGEATGSNALPNADNTSNAPKDKKKNDERENAVWYEYGCV